VLIVDDEAPARRRLRRLLRAAENVEVVGEAADGSAALSQTATLRPDVVLLDIQMPAPSGLDVVARLGRPGPAIVFVTAHDTHAVRAFELHALDYLLKPVSGPRLMEAIDRARQARAPFRDDDRLDAWRSWTRPGQPLARLPVRAAGRLDLVDVTTIDWIEAADNYAILHCGARSHILRDTLSNLAARLDSRAFLRIHRSTLVQASRIDRLEPIARGDWRVILRDGTALVMSRTCRPAVMAALHGRPDPESRGA